MDTIYGHVLFLTSDSFTRLLHVSITRVFQGSPLKYYSAFLNRHRITIKKGSPSTLPFPLSAVVQLAQLEEFQMTVQLHPIFLLVVDFYSLFITILALLRSQTSREVIKAVTDSKGGTFDTIARKPVTLSAAVR